MATTAVFDAGARLRAAQTDVAVDVREIVLDAAPAHLNGKTVQVSVGDKRPVTFDGVLRLNSDGSATLRRPAASRAAFRVVVALDVHVARPHDPRGLDAVTRDLSLAGTLLNAAASDLRVGEQVELTVAVDPHPVRVSGTVVRSPGACRAVRFDAFAPGAERRLELYLAGVQRRQLAAR